MDQTAIVIVIYLLAIMAIGARGGKIRGLEGFHLARRSLEPFLLTGTFCATIVGASSTIGMAGLGFSRGLPGAWWMLSGTIGLLVLSFFFAEKVRKTGCYTLPEMAGSFYGEHFRVAASILIVLSWIGVIAAQILASGKILGILFSQSETLFMVACTAVFIIYTAHGGQNSVVRTDLVQFSVIVLGMILLFSKAAEAGASGTGTLSGLSFPTSPQMGAFDVISMIAVVGSSYLIGPDMYSRIFSAKSPGIAKKSSAAAALVLIPLAFLIASLGVFSKALYPGITPEQAIPALMTGLLSPIPAGIVGAALLAAFMSSADTTLMTATSILSLDLYRRARPESSQERLMAVSRASVLILGFAALLLAMSMPTVIGALMLAYTVYSGGMLVPLIAGFYRDRLGLTPSGALAALIGGGSVALVLGQKYPLAGMATSATLLIAVSVLERRFYKS